MAGSSLGMALGCLLGMIPLAFLSFKKGDREDAPSDIFGTVATIAPQILNAEKVTVLTVDHSTMTDQYTYRQEDMVRDGRSILLKSLLLLL